MCTLRFLTLQTWRIPFVRSLTHWLPDLFAKNVLFGHFGEFQTGYEPNSSNLFKRHLQHDSMPFFPQASRFTTCLLRHEQKSKFLRVFERKWSTSLALSFFLIFSPFPLLFFLFSSFCCSHWLSTGLTSSSKNSRKHHREGQFYMIME